MKLLCAIVRGAGSASSVDIDALVRGVGCAFPVDIDAGQSVGDLKDVIKAKNRATITCDAKDLQLFRTDTKGEWLTKADVENGVGTAGLTPLTTAGAPLKLAGLSETSVQVEITEDMVEANRTPVHVVAVLPKGGNVEHDRVGVPKGRAVDTTSCDDLLAFLESEMTNKEEIVVNQNILTAESLQFRLVGREEAIKTAADCFNRIIEASRGAGLDRTHRPIPVCSGISGLGKTRMLEESGTILEEMKLDPEYVVRLIVSYYNGYKSVPVERSMPIEASFSWRLLYRFFLNKNCAFDFATWFELRLPCNGSQLTFRNAIAIIERKLRQSVQGQRVQYIFVGIDEYQKIKKLKTSGANAGTSILRELVETIADFLCTNSSSLVVLPMFAGTDLGVIAPDSTANSSHFVIKRLPMTLLTLGQVLTSVESNANFAGFLRHTQVYRHLFALGGVPRWIVEYLLGLKRCSEPDTITLRGINRCFMGVWTTYVDAYTGLISTHQLVRLAAYAVSGRQVRHQDAFDKQFKWSKLRDSSVCVLNPSFSTPNVCDVRVPYALLRSIASSDDMKTTAEIFFTAALSDIGKLVDSKLFVHEPWQSWEMFGACFYAARINALLVLGHSTVTLGELLPGALMSDDTRRISVKLAPSRVFQCAESFGSSTPMVVSQKYHLAEKVDWTSSGNIIVNGVGGAGVDIFFALKDARSENLIVFVDQRKRHFGKFQPESAREYLRKLRNSRPAFLEKGTRLVGGVMDCVAPSNLQDYVVPSDCFLLTRDETERFHGTLAYHPACTPIVPMNSANKTALKSVLKGSEEQVDRAAEEILRKRMEPSGGFINYEAMRSHFKVMKLDVEVDTEYAVCTD